MANWVSELAIKDLLNCGKAPNELCKSMAERLRKVESIHFDPEVRAQRDELAEQFEILSSDIETDNDAFNYLLSDLYDWADQSLDGTFGGKKVCWVSSM